MASRVRIFDTTLRDGEQSPGFSLNDSEKLTMADQLARLKVDVIEAGFPAASDGDFESVKSIAESVRGVEIAGLCRAHRGDIDRCWEAVRHGRKPRIHTFIATSDIHLEHKLEMTRKEALAAAAKAVSYARSLCDNVEFSAEDATRSDRDFLLEVVRAAANAGATTLNIPDTVGYTTPDEFFELISFLKEGLGGAKGLTLSVHCHNDLGLAVANTLAALRAGARQAECTVNGIGERAGNASVEEIVMTLETRKELYGLTTRVNSREITKTSRMLTMLTGISVQPNKAIVGDNAFAHEAGIHQHGVLSNALTYEIMTPESVGLESNRLVLGKHSGRHAVRERLRYLAFDLDKSEMDQVFTRFKELADKKGEVYDEDLEALAADASKGFVRHYVLQGMTVVSGAGRGGQASAVVRVCVLGEDVEAAGMGDGPVDAVIHALKKMTGMDAHLHRYHVKSLTGSSAAMGQATMVLSVEGELVRGNAAHTDIVSASAQAWLNALERWHRQRERGSRRISAQGSPLNGNGKRRKTGSSSRKKSGTRKRAGSRASAASAARS